MEVAEWLSKIFEINLSLTVMNKNYFKQYFKIFNSDSIVSITIQFLEFRNLL